MEFLVLPQNEAVFAKCRSNCDDCDNCNDCNNCNDWCVDVDCFNCFYN